MWELQMSLVDMPDIVPVSRRRAYSDCTRKKGLPKLIPKRQAAAIEGPYVVIPSALSNNRSGSPVSFKDASFASGDITPPSTGTNSYEGSPKSPNPYAGLVVGSLLGSGPLNGAPVNNSSGLSPLCEGSPLANSPAKDTSVECFPCLDIVPYRRPRLPSLSEVPSVAPIPEHKALGETPPRPPLRQKDLEPLPFPNKEQYEEDVFAEEDEEDPSLSSKLPQPTAEGSIEGHKPAPNNSQHPPEDSHNGTLQEKESQSSQGPPLDSKKPQEEAEVSNGEEITFAPQSFRQRAGTWSLANSLRAKSRKEKEGEATRQRQRRRSGDDTTLPPPSGMPRREQQLQVTFADAKTEDKPLSSRQRRKSGDDVLNASATKDKKKDAFPGFLVDTFRPRSKSDAARQGKKSTIMATVKNAVQHTLVSSGGHPGQRGGRRSGDHTPVEQNNDDVTHHTWHAGYKSAKLKVWDVFRSVHRSESTEDKIRRKSGGRNEKGQLNRRHSMEPDKRRFGGSGTIYLRGDNPDLAATTFRDCRGLPATAVFLEKVRRSDLEEDETQILVKFFKYHHTYDLIPTSAKLVIFDTRLQVKKAFYALVYNVVRAAPLWDSRRQEFVGMLTITDFIRILQSFYARNIKMEELEEHTIERWRALLHDDGRSLVSIGPGATLYDAIHTLIHHKIHRLPVIDPSTGNVLYIITHKRILKFLYLYINELPKPSVMHQSLGQLRIGTYNNIETARQETLLIEALNKFVNRRISALPIVDADGKLIDIYAKFDVLNLAAKGTYNKLDVTLQEANEYRNEWFEGVRKCNFDETLGTIMERIVKAEVHRLVVVDREDRVTGIISLSDILDELVLKPCNDAMRKATISDMEAKLCCEDDTTLLRQDRRTPPPLSDSSSTKDANASSDTNE